MKEELFSKVIKCCTLSLSDSVIISVGGVILE